MATVRWISRLLTFIVVFFLWSHAFADDFKLVKDIAYGNHDKQALDIYYPSDPVLDAPVIFMVHGGAWRIGDKASKSVIKNKVKHWVPKGFIFISVNYRMLPDTGPLEQANDVAKALQYSQKHIANRGGSSKKFILMGHSAGAHLVSLVSVRKKADRNTEPLLGTIALDSAAFDIENIMRSSPRRFYKKAFGNNPDYWKQASPIHNLDNEIAPFLAICSSKRKDDSCSDARRFVQLAKAHGSEALTLSIGLSHRGINTELGKDQHYTQKVDAFLQTLHPSIKQLFR